MSRETGLIGILVVAAIAVLAYLVYLKWPKTSTSTPTGSTTCTGVQVGSFCLGSGASATYAEQPDNPSTLTGTNKGPTVNKDTTTGPAQSGGTTALPDYWQDLMIYLNQVATDTELRW